MDGARGNSHALFNVLGALNSRLNGVKTHVERGFFDGCSRDFGVFEAGR